MNFPPTVMICGETLVLGPSFLSYTHPNIVRVLHLTYSSTNRRHVPHPGELNGVKFTFCEPGLLILYEESLCLAPSGFPLCNQRTRHEPSFHTVRTIQIWFLVGEDYTYCTAADPEH